MMRSKKRVSVKTCCEGCCRTVAVKPPCQAVAADRTERMASKETFDDDAKEQGSKEEEEGVYGDESKWEGTGRQAEGKEDKEVATSSSDQKSHGHLSEEEIVERLQAYFFEDDQLSSYFEKFIKDNCHVVDLASEEYKLEYTTVFNEYKRIFEEKMESFITDSLHVSVQEVYSALKNKVENDENSMGAFFAQILIAVTDFDVFMNIMREMAAVEKALHK